MESRALFGTSKYYGDTNNVGTFYYITETTYILWP